MAAELIVTNPYDGSEVGRVPTVDAAAVTAAVDRAAVALEKGLPAHERAAVLDRCAAALAERVDELAQTLAAEAAKPLKQAKVEVQRAVQTFTFAATACRTLAGEVVPMDAHPSGEGKLAFTLRVPIGVHRRHHAVQLPAQPRGPQGWHRRSPLAARSW